jgi:hypothetical protein
MSDPVTNAEIEDVLSSIRRLVSEDVRHASPDPIRAKPLESGRLVLTPALRVADAVEVAEPEPEDHDTAPPWADPGATLFEAATDMNSEAGAWPSADRDSDEFDRRGESEDFAEEISGTDEYEFAEEDLVEEDFAEEEASSGDFEDDELQDDEFQDSSVEDRAFADADAEDSRIGDQIPDLKDHPELPEKATADTGWAEMEMPAQEMPIDTGDLTGAPLAATVAALETTIGETPDQWEPDGVGGDEYAGTPVETLQWEDHAAGVEAMREQGADTVPFATRSPEPEVPGLNDSLDPIGEETILDEESLRELVTDIVREELQGALGERITRNVRKLVRREIHRALTAQELE